MIKKQYFLFILIGSRKLAYNFPCADYENSGQYLCQKECARYDFEELDSPRFTPSMSQSAMIMNIGAMSMIEL